MPRCPTRPAASSAPSIKPTAWTALATAFLFGAAACGGSAAKPEPLTPWLTYSAQQRTVTITAVAGYQGINGGRNFNGYFRGEVLITSPRGWNVTVNCVNAGSAPHWCAIVSNPLATRPAFTRASTSKPTIGLPPGHSSAFSFHPTQPGSYRLASLAADDELMGMWDVPQIGNAPRPTVTLLRTYGR